MNIIDKFVFHKKYEDGMITEYEDGVITVEFMNRIAKFKIPDAFNRGFLTTESEELLEYVKELSRKEAKENNSSGYKAGECAIVFCNISWMKDYLGEDGDEPVNGGSYVREHKLCNESLNFCPITLSGECNIDGKVMLLGSYETKSSNRITPNQTHIEKIRSANVSVHSQQVSGVTVVWCATHEDGGSFVVGWYKNATVYRHYRQMPIENDDGTEWKRWYNVTCEYGNAVLLPEKERTKTKWHIPRSKKGNNENFGFGQSNIWYAKEKSAEPFVEDMLNKINTYNGENNIMELE